MSAERGRGRGLGDRGRGQGGLGGGQNNRGRDARREPGSESGAATNLTFHTGRGGERGRGRGRGGGIYSPNYELMSPDPSITEFEDEVISRQTEKERDSSLLDCKLPVRPAYGKSGTPIVLRTNFFELKLSKANQQLFRYDVSFDPDKKSSDQNADDKISSRKKRRYIELLLQDPVFGNHCATDHSSIIISSQPLSLSGKSFQRFTVVRWEPYEEPFPAATPDEPASRQKARQRRKATLEVKFNKTYTVKDLFDFVQSSQPGATYTASKDIVQAMNIVFARAPNFHPQVVRVGQNKFYPFHDKYIGNHGLEQAHELGQGMQALRGAYSSVRLGPSRVLVNISVASGVFFKEGLLSNLMEAILRDRCGLKQMERLLKGLRVITIHAKSEEKTADGKAKTVQKVHAIYSLADKPRLGANSQEVKFSPRDKAPGQKQSISVEEYFKSHYNISLKLPMLPVVNVGSKKEPIYLPPEICYVHGGQSARAVLSSAQTSKMINFAARYPNSNAESIEGPSLKIFQVSDTEQKQSIEVFGFQMETQMLTVPARVLPLVRINFENKTVTPKDGQWNLNGAKFKQGARMGKFSGLEIRPEIRDPNRQHLPNLTVDFGATFTIVAGELKSYGMKIDETLRPGNPITVPELHDPKNWGSIASKVDNALKELAAKGVKWLLVSIPEQNGFLYSAIKTPADTKYGIQTVVIQNGNAAKINGKDPGLVANLALKFCGKAGGTCWAFNPDDLPGIDNAMLVGLDVTHPSPGSRESAPSVVAIVASVNERLSSWPGNLCVQRGGQEMVENLTELMVERLRLWQKRNNNQLPKKIIMFRDGVSEGQFSKVLDTEYPSMLKAFDQVYGQRSKHPRVSISIVGKRHHTRFYPTGQDYTDKKSWNPVPGVVVDRHVTGYGEGIWDFYLQPHKVIQGTAKPAHYVVLKDEIGFTHEQFEKLTHTLCHGFHRATKAVSICAPAYCADLLAQRGRCYRYKEFNEPARSDSDSDINTAAWTKGVHHTIRDSMFYI